MATGNTLDESKEKIARISGAHVTYLKSLGLVVNETKTEAVIFTKKDIIISDINIAGTIVQTKEKMKVLGIIFDANLKWEAHINNTLKKCKNKLGVLKRLRRRFTKDQFLQIVTAQYFSNLYYCAPVWLNETTSSRLRRMINSAHYRPLRIAMKDYNYRLAKKDLLKSCNRSSPMEWARYSLASIAIKTLTNREPFHLYNSLSKSLYTTRRKPSIGLFFFYDKSKGKIGKARN